MKYKIGDIVRATDRSPSKGFAGKVVNIFDTEFMLQTFPGWYSNDIWSQLFPGWEEKCTYLIKPFISMKATCAHSGEKFFSADPCVFCEDALEQYDWVREMEAKI